MFIRVGQLATLQEHTGILNRNLLLDREGNSVTSKTFKQEVASLDQVDIKDTVEALMNVVALVRVLMDIPVAGMPENLGSIGLQ